MDRGTCFGVNRCLPTSTWWWQAWALGFRRAGFEFCLCLFISWTVLARFFIFVLSCFVWFGLVLLFWVWFSLWNGKAGLSGLLRMKQGMFIKCPGRSLAHNVQLLVLSTFCHLLSKGTYIKDIIYWKLTTHSVLWQVLYIVYPGLTAAPEDIDEKQRSWKVESLLPGQQVGEPRCKSRSLRLEVMALSSLGYVFWMPTLRSPPRLWGKECWCRI